MPDILSVSQLSKTYASGHRALDAVDLSIRQGEIFALLGPNGAGKTTLISIVCGIVRATGGSVTVGGHDIVRDWRAARALIGLVPQELTNDAFESVRGTVAFSRGLFGKPPDPALIERVLRSLSLWDKRDARLRTLSGGMKRRVLIAKALAHEPRVLFLDEPSAGVDVELRRDMWQLVRGLRDTGVTVILTTHYIEEAEEMADRIGVISRGRLILVEDKAELMRKLGKKRLTLQLRQPIARVPAALADYALELSADGTELGAAGGLRAPPGRGRPRVQGPAHHAELARGHLRRPGAQGGRMSPQLESIRAIYGFEMARTRRTLMGSILSPVISTSLYFVVFGAAIGSRIPEVGGVGYGAFIVPGLVMLSLLTQSISNASFGIYFPRFSGTIYELLSAPVSAVEIVIGYVGAAATKSILIGLIILATAALFVPLRIEHPGWMLAYLVLTAVTFSLVGFVIGIWADGFEKLQVVPLLVVTPLTFLGGTFYSIDMLPPFWQTVALFNPVVYLVSGFRWSFYGTGDVSLATSLGVTVLFLAAALGVVTWIFRTGYRLKA